MKIVAKGKYTDFEEVGSIKVVKPKSETAELLDAVRNLSISITKIASTPAPEIKIPEFKFETTEILKALKSLSLRIEALIIKPLPASQIIVQPTAVKIDMPKPAKKWNFNGKRSDLGEWNITAERME